MYIVLKMRIYFFLFWYRLLEYHIYCYILIKYQLLCYIIYDYQIILLILLIKLFRLMAFILKIVLHGFINQSILFGGSCGQVLNIMDVNLIVLVFSFNFLMIVANLLWIYYDLNVVSRISFLYNEHRIFQ